MKFFPLYLVLLLFACRNEPTGQFIINKSIENSGGILYENSIVEFDFRERHYQIERKEGTFSMIRTTQNDTTTIVDRLSNDGFERSINGSSSFVSDSMATKYSESINSVSYFALLPYRLNDEAVVKKYLDKVTINDKEYYKIEVRFKEEGGGIDFQDVYVYWMDTDSYKIDYLAYSFTVNGGGMRFRKAYNERIVNGIRFVDYINYKPISEVGSVHDLDQVFLNDGLEELSRIELKSIQVSTAN